MSAFRQIFDKEYAELLITPINGNPIRDRKAGFGFIFDLIDRRINSHSEYFNILETGSMRADHGELNFSGDGCSTYIFNRFCSKQLLSRHFAFEINEDNANYTASRLIEPKKTAIILGDSVREISRLHDEYVGNSLKFDLVYLDSFDVEKGNNHPSSLHHLMELLSVLPMCKKGTILAIDDHDAFFDGGKSGKAVYIKEYMDRIGVKPAFEGYQLIYIL